jgi:transcriptional regulator with XRE-family HTH domain
MNIKDERDKKNITQKELADGIGITTRQLMRYENEGLTPKPIVSNAINSFIEKYDINSHGKNQKQIKSKNDTTKNITTNAGIPVYDIEFSLGFTEKIKDSPSVLGYINMEEFRGCDGIVRARGESMAKKINNGDWIGFKRIFDFDVINFGNPYGIVTKEMDMIKYIKKGTDKNSFLLQCENKDYQDFEILKSKILELYLIKTVMPIIAFM